MSKRNTKTIEFGVTDYGVTHLNLEEEKSWEGNKTCAKKFWGAMCIVAFAALVFVSVYVVLFTNGFIADQSKNTNDNTVPIPDEVLKKENSTFTTQQKSLDTSTTSSPFSISTSSPQVPTTTATKPIIVATTENNMNFCIDVCYTDSITCAQECVNIKTECLASCEYSSSRRCVDMCDSHFRRCRINCNNQYTFCNSNCQKNQ